jgi:D-cysteine desulfhydrase
VNLAAFPLYRRFPQLVERLPRVDLCGGPSPVRRLVALEAHLGRDLLWLKDDGVLGTIYGGNKVRKLEFILADALHRGARIILTFGGTGSHHCLATALYAPRFGLRVTCVLLEQPASDEVRANLALLRASGARVALAGSLAGATARAAWLAVRCTEPGLPPRFPYLLWVGGSIPLGCLGYVNAALELAQQVGEGLLPAPKTIVVPLGSNGTAAGLLLGLRLAGLDSRVIAVQVSDLPAVGAGGVAHLANSTARLLRRHDASVPSLHFRAADVTVISTPEARRYGQPTRQGEEAKQLLEQLEGLALDSTYTAKAVAALIDEPELPRPLLYWHTHNARRLPPCG